MTPEAVAALVNFIVRGAQLEAARSQNPQEILRAERAKQYWLATGLIKRSVYPS